jgi:hypothetical protein
MVRDILLESCIRNIAKDCYGWIWVHVPVLWVAGFGCHRVAVALIREFGLTPPFVSFMGIFSSLTPASGSWPFLHVLLDV